MRPQVRVRGRATRIFPAMVALQRRRSRPKLSRSTFWRKTSLIWKIWPIASPPGRCTTSSSSTAYGCPEKPSFLSRSPAGVLPARISPGRNAPRHGRRCCSGSLLQRLPLRTARPDYRSRERGVAACLLAALHVSCGKTGKRCAPLNPKIEAGVIPQRVHAQRWQEGLRARAAL